MKRRLLFLVFSFIGVLAFSEGGLCFNDCFNYAFPRQDLFRDKDGLEIIKEWKKERENLLLEKRWPTAKLKLTSKEEVRKFGTTGLEEFKRSYLLYHFDGSDMRMFVYVRIVRSRGERKVAGWRSETNPAMPLEYLDPNYPEEKKEGVDFKLLVHWVYPPDIRGSGILACSYNDKVKDQDTWMWFPSLRKVRRLTPANGGDSMVGTYKTVSECITRTVTDEVSQVIGETVVQMAMLPFDILDNLHVLNKYGPNSKEYSLFIRRIAQPRECWVVRSISVKGGECDYYHTRIWAVDKEWGYGPIFEEMYDSKGGLMATHIFPWRRQTGYNGEIRAGWYAWSEDLSFEEDGASYWAAPQSNQGYKNPDTWFTLRELQKSVPTVMIPYMAVLPPPPEKLLPIETLLPGKELQEVYHRHFPERFTNIPVEDPAIPIGMDKVEAK